MADGSETLSSILHSALDADNDGTVTVGEVVDRVRERSFGLLLVLVGLPAMIPIFPPGASAVIGTIYILLGLQMIVARKRVWLPKRIRNYRMSPKMVAGLQNKGAWLFSRIERFTRPRLDFVRADIAVSVVALVVIGLGIVLFFPIPLMNTAPAFALVLVGVGMMNRDGVMVLVGAALGAGLIVTVIFAIDVLKDLMVSIRNWIGL